MKYLLAKTHCGAVGYNTGPCLFTSRVFTRPPGAFKGVDVELQDLKRVTDELNPGQARARIKKSWARDGALDRNRYEKALHRLVVLGVVSDYTVDYSAREFNINLSGISREGIAESLGLYIGAYQSSLGHQFEQRAQAIENTTETAYKHE